jgi:hypothetical protein
VLLSADARLAADSSHAIDFAPIQPLEWEPSRFLIACLGMSEASMTSFDADGQWEIVHRAPGSGLVPVRPGGGPAPTIDDVLFLADCISFDHDLPTVVRPSAETNVAGMRPSGSLLPSPAASAGLWYSDVLPEAQGLAAEMRLGAPVVLRYGEGERSLVQFESRFAGVGEALGFYAMALRELDEPGEYLGMYRLLAWADGDDGRSFVATHLKSVAEFDFGMLRTEPNRHGTSVDVFEHYRELALARLRALRSSGMSDSRIADHLLGVRAGLARSGRLPGANAGGAVVSGVAHDLPVVKLLARIALDGA